MSALSIEWLEHLASSNQPEACLRACKAALALNPDNPRVLEIAVGVAFELKQLDAALGYMETLAKLVQSEPHIRYDLGCLLAEAGRLKDAKRTFEITLELDDRFDPARIALGNLLYHGNDLEGAAALFEDVLQRDETNAEALAGLGRVSAARGKIGGAIDTLEKAQVLAGEDASISAELGNTHLIAGNFDEAARAYQQALDMDPRQFNAYFGLSMLPGRTLGEEQIEFLEHIGEDKSISDIDFIYASFALGRTFEANGDYDAAFRRFAAGNARRRALDPYDFDADRKLADTMIQTFDETALASTGAKTSPVSDPLFIVGMPRSGSTLVEQILSSHSDVVGGGELGIVQEQSWRSGTIRKSKGGLAIDLSKDGLANLRTTCMAIYEDRIGRDKRITDKSLQNTFYIGLIAKIFPDAKFIHVRREPMDIGLSCFTSLFESRQNFAFDLEDIVHYFQIYADLMAHWCGLMPSRIYDLSYEDLVGDTRNSIAELLDFAGLDWQESCLNFQENKRAVMTHSAAQVRQPIYSASVARWQRYGNHLGPLLPMRGMI